MSVKLIDYTGAGSDDPLYAARLLVYTKSTRLPQGAATRAQIAEMGWDAINEELEYMSKTIPSSWEFVNYVFEVTDVPVATTRQMTRTRHASFAEQSMRVTDMRDFRTFVPETIHKKGMTTKWEHLMRLIALAYREFADAGVPAEDARGVLPLNTYSSIIVKYDLKTFSDLVGKRRSLRAQGFYRDVVEQMQEQIYQVHPWATLFIEPDRSQTPFLDKLIEEVCDGRPLTELPELAGAVKELEKLKGIH